MVLGVHSAILGVKIGESGKKSSIVPLFRHTLILGPVISEPDFPFADRHHALASSGLALNRPRIPTAREWGRAAPSLDGALEIDYMHKNSEQIRPRNRSNVHMRESCMTSNENTEQPRPASSIKLWLVAARVFALPASAMPVAFGTVLAITIGDASFDFALFAASLVGMALLHTGANLLNDAYDYRRGIDRQVNPVSGAVVRQWITPGQALKAAALSLTAGSLIGLYIVSRVGPPILYIGVAGVLIGVLYTWGPWPLKDHAFGDLAVFLDFGILGALGAWTVQTGRPSWVPAVWAVPMSLLVSAILHSNNWRDIGTDADGRIRTVASYLGDAGSQTYYRILLFGPFAIIAFLVLMTHAADISPRMPATFLITLLAVPMAVRLVRTGSQRHDPQKSMAFAAMDGATAQLNLVFGLLCVAALGLHALIQ